MANKSEVERIAALETEVRKDRDHILSAIGDLKDSQKSHFEAADERLSKLERRLDGHENKGKGILIGVGIAAATTGASILAILERTFGAFK